MATAASAPAPAGRSLEPVNLAGRFEILPGTPLPSLDGPGGAAFAVRSLRDRKMDVFARVGTLGVPARMDLLSGIRGIEHVALMRMVEWGMMDWPPDGMKRIVFILENPGGRRLMNSLNDTREQMTEEQITRAVIQPLASALRELSSRGIVHGDIRPTNIFLRDQGTSGIMLGECVSAVTSFGQAPLLLTVERAMAQPSGRGVGSTADDLYALGITILLLFMGRNPVRQLDDEAMLQAKIDRGTYPALVGTSRISLNLMEPLRGHAGRRSEAALVAERPGAVDERAAAEPSAASGAAQGVAAIRTGGNTVLALPGAGAGLRPQSGGGGSADRKRRAGSLAAAQPGRRSQGRGRRLRGRIRQAWRGVAPISRIGWSAGCVWRSIRRGLSVTSRNR